MRLGECRLGLGDRHQGAARQAAGGRRGRGAVRNMPAPAGFTALAITIDHALRAGAMPGAHRDPFDRMLIAQAQAERLPLISNETVFDAYAVERLW